MEGGVWPYLATGAITLAGTITGYLLSERQTTNRERRTEQRRRESVRALLTIEIDENLATLDELWKRIGDETDEEAQAYERAEIFVALPAPVWNSLMWETQAPELRIALDDTEVIAVYQLYNSLKRLSAIRARLAEMQAADQTMQNASGGVVGAISMLGWMNMMFPREAPDAWRECERIVTGLMRGGNPLR